VSPNRPAGLRREALSTVLLSALLCAAGCASEPPRGLVVISLDTVRQDHVSAYGYERSTTPQLDRLAERGVLFTGAFSQEVNTAPSHASMFTGAYPHEHGCLSNGHELPPHHATLAGILHSAGFRTAGFVSGFPMRSRISRLDRGFEVWNDAFRGLRRDGRETTALALRWLSERAADERYFLFLHLYDAHGRYEPPERYRGLFSPDDDGRLLESIPKYQRIVDEEGRLVRRLGDYVARYDASIRFLDDLVARVLEAVDLDETVVVVLSDHGETLGERHHVLDHGAQLFDEQIRIPLVLAAPGLPPGRVDAMVETVDLLPTLLTLLGIRTAGALQIAGRDFLPVIEGRAPGRTRVHAAARAVAARHADRGYRLDPSRRLLAVRSDRWKLIRYPGRGEDPVELYDLRADPLEREDLADVRPQPRGQLQAALDGWQGSGAVEPAPQLSEEERRGLEALGYID